jgi:hypothetical protein
MLRDKREECVSNPNPVKVPDYIDADAQALRAVSEGRATEGQQKQALDFIINRIARTYEVSFHPNSERLTSFAEGMRRVGQVIVYLLYDAPTKTDTAKIEARNLESRNNE